MTERALVAMADSRTTSCIALGADAQRIEATFEFLLGSAKGEEAAGVRL